MRPTAHHLAIVMVLLAAVSVALSQVVLPWQGQDEDEPNGPGFGHSAPRSAREMHQDHARRMREFQQRMEAMQRQAEESRNMAIRQALGVDEGQYRRIKPKLEAIDRLKAEAEVAVDPSSLGAGPNVQGGGMAFRGGFTGGSVGGMGGFGAGGMAGGPQGRTWTRTWSWGTPSTGNAANAPKGQRLCNEIVQALHSPTVSPAELAQKVEALRRHRAKARQDLEKARQNLRTLVAPTQQPILIAMGYLE